jgi:hypothetical protein
MPAPRPWWTRFFPSTPVQRIEGDKRTYLTTVAVVHVDWRDRLRLLVSGRFRMELLTYTDVEVQSATSVPTFSVEAPGGR